MGFWKRLFGGGSFVPAKKTSHQLPSTIVAKEFGEVNVSKGGGQTDVTFTILMEPSGAEGWQTGVAIDASRSMAGVFDKGLIEPLARRVTAYLAANLDADGGTTVIYWACGADGRQLEVIGDLTAEDCNRAEFRGPSKNDFGNGTYLTPAVRYFVDRFKDAKNGIYIFITDGELNDLPDVKSYTIQLCKDITAKRRNALKCVLIGIGENINEDQMEQLDDLESGTDVDVWDHKIARDMRALVEIFAEVVSENQIVAPTARIFDSSGNLVKNFSDGLPAKVSFSMPSSSNWFELEVAGDRIRQPVE